jgi:hypothetical protein
MMRALRADADLILSDLAGPDPAQCERIAVGVVEGHIKVTL